MAPSPDDDDQAAPVATSPREELFGPKPTDADTSELASHVEARQMPNGHKFFTSELARQRVASAPPSRQHFAPVAAEQQPQYLGSPSERATHIEALVGLIRQIRQDVHSALGDSARRPSDSARDVKKSELWSSEVRALKLVSTNQAFGIEDVDRRHAADVDRLYKKGRGEFAPSPIGMPSEEVADLLSPQCARTRWPSQGPSPMTSARLSNLLQSSSMQDLATLSQVLGSRDTAETGQVEPAVTRRTSSPVGTSGAQPIFTTLPVTRRTSSPTLVSAGYGWVAPVSSRDAISGGDHGRSRYDTNLVSAALPARGRLEVRHVTNRQASLSPTVVGPSAWAAEGKRLTQVAANGIAGAASPMPPRCHASISLDLPSPADITSRSKLYTTASAPEAKSSEQPTTSGVDLPSFPSGDGNCTVNHVERAHTALGRQERLQEPRRVEANRKISEAFVEVMFDPNSVKNSLTEQSGQSKGTAFAVSGAAVDAATPSTIRPQSISLEAEGLLASKAMGLRSSAMQPISDLQQIAASLERRAEASATRLSPHLATQSSRHSTGNVGGRISPAYPKIAIFEAEQPSPRKAAMVEAATASFAASTRATVQKPTPVPAITVPEALS